MVAEGGAGAAKEESGFGGAVDDRLAKELGYLTSEFGYFEMVARTVVSVLAGVKGYVGIALTANHGIKAVLDMWGAVASVTLETNELKVRSAEILARAAAATEQRNAIVHGVWGVSRVPPTGETILNRVQARMKKGLVIREVPTTAEQVREVTLEVRAITGEMLGFIDAVDPEAMKLPPGIEI